MGIREDIRQETSEEIARRLIFDGRVSDEDIAAGCGLTPERVQELISEVAHETRELLQELRKMLFDIRNPEISDEDRRDILLQIVMLLRLMIDNEVCEEPEQAAQQAANAKYIEQLRLEAGMTDDEDIPFD